MRIDIQNHLSKQQNQIKTIRKTYSKIAIFIVLFLLSSNAEYTHINVIYSKNLGAHHDPNSCSVQQHATSLQKNYCKKA